MPSRITVTVTCDHQPHERCFCRTIAEASAIDRAVDAFAEAMREKLHHRQRQGRAGWDRDDWADECRMALAEHVAKGDPVDVANYAMFLWNMGERTCCADTGPHCCPDCGAATEECGCFRADAGKRS